MRRRLIAGNWKMYKTLADTRAFFSSFLPPVAAAKHCDIVVAPPFTSISTAFEAAKGSTVAISGQNVSWSKRSEEHTSELQSHLNLVCRLLLEKKKTMR